MSYNEQKEDSPSDKIVKVKEDSLTEEIKINRETRQLYQKNLSTSFIQNEFLQSNK